MTNTTANDKMNNPLKFRFHGLYDNTSNVLQGSNNFPYGAPKPSLADDDLPFGDETVKAPKSDDDLLPDD